MKCAIALKQLSMQNTNKNFVIMARTDALGQLKVWIKPLNAFNNYVEAGAEMIFFEGATELQSISSRHQSMQRACARQYH